MNFMNFINEHWSELLSVVGAAAWLPIVLTPMINYMRKVQATLLDLKLLTNGYSISANQKENKSGTILLMAMNLFINKLTVFARNLEVNVILKNGAVLKSEMLDFSTLTSNYDDGIQCKFILPNEQEFNISRTIHPNVDNIKFLAILVESASFDSVDDISKIEIILYYSKIKHKIFSKKVVLTYEEFPKFNSSRLIEKVEIVTNGEHT